MNVCMYVCVYESNLVAVILYVGGYDFICMKVYMHVWAYIPTYIHIHTYVCMYMKVIECGE